MRKVFASIFSWELLAFIWICGGAYQIYTDSGDWKFSMIMGTCMLLLSRISFNQKIKTETETKATEESE